MMKRHSHLFKQNQRGFTLMELLLSIGLLAMLMAGLYKVFDDWSQRAVNRTAAAEMLRVQNAAQDYVYANFDEIAAINDLVFHTIPIADLIAGNHLPAGFQAQNTFRQPIRVFHRNIRVNRLRADGSVAGQYITVQVLTVSDNPGGSIIRVPNQRLLDIARAGGPKMGFFSRIIQPGINYNNGIMGIYNEWAIENVMDLRSLGYNADPDNEGGYLASFGLVSNEGREVNDDLLYRVSIPGRPELNRMETQLLMNGNPIENAGTVVADRVQVEGNATFRGMAQGVAAETAQAMTVEQALRVDGADQTRFNMKTSTPGCAFVDVGGGNRTITGAGCTISGGDIQVVAPTEHASLNIGTLTADGSILADVSSVTGTTDARGVSAFDTVTGSSMSMSNNVVVPTANFNGGDALNPTITTQQLQTANMNVTAASSAGSLAAASVRTNNNNLIATTVNIGNTVELTGSIIANGVNATNTLYVQTATSGYRDAVLARNVICTSYSGRVYCEPSGPASWNIDGVTYREECSVHGTGYQCWHYRNGSPYGYCNFTRTTGASGQAYHTSSCS